MAQRIIAYPWFNKAVIALLLINAAILGFETTPGLAPETVRALHTADHIILGIFCVEIALRMIASGLLFFTSAWNLFDFTIIAISFLPFMGEFAVLRSLRILRLLRLFSIVPKFRRVVNAIITAIPGIFSIVLIMMVFYYVFAVIATHLYAAEFPLWFGSLGKSMFTLFQVMTLEGWATDIVRPIMEVHPGAWAFFVCFILVTTFTMLNLFIAIIINAMQQQEPRRRAGDPHDLDIAKLRKGS